MMWSLYSLAVVPIPTPTSSTENWVDPDPTSSLIFVPPAGFGDVVPIPTPL